MSESVRTNTSIWSKGMLSVIVAQFLSAFGDNALLFATLALLKAQFYPDWSQPVLQMVFVGAYILFAPFVGQIADSFAKGRVMMVANGLKLAGAAGICLGVNPFVGYTLVGIGAAAYSPAKYGILGELTTGDKLVKANGLMEASTIAAILLGSVAGGVLADWHVIAALVACALAYAGAVAANLFIPKLVAARPGQSWRLSAMTRSFFCACVVLWRNGETRFSLVGTGLFWGAGVTLRFLLVLWVPVALGITDNATPTYLNAMVAVGIVVGAGAAAKLVTLETVSRCMPAGILIGVVVAIFSLQHALLPAYALLLLIGMLGGFFVVPLNALLQERGKKSVGAGNAIAVQNLGENSAMLLMLGLYSLAVLVGVPAVAIGIGFGVLFALAIAALWIWQRRQALY
ncbi:TPA: lysophospholipid transporter LplT [Salmonella enterica subsp. enterica serovar Brandenburg]|uniref:Lysophospholipid transporter LplT n=1 Tax=Salmonella enterica subsp. enterica serovar Brandenburg TaxID=149387 RepID=A0A723W8D3_SALET|nr:lysophospholipid transporter LplT [Salmonella enterica subsp. enterica serovar Brandenburg]HCK3194897.1 lysophospholipid transporter LplT [Salmonella enterica subsp. enterica serovar Brandenburg]HCK3201700.1 lysophospholipid transporter LplT [Salmonella enterica subsp. enterica serovar Brandenburg]HCM3098899.1 lysophospholipid transporter LplT [Salmonella enterica subsp. enterica serovar Brandenburg]HCM3107081.1 lysophospholipid transporter LplT [Salmonella enterica subsp. enterica serovar B